MKIDLSFAELHTPLFLTGKNHGQKLYAKDLGLTYSTDMDQLYVFYKDTVAICPSSNISSMTPIDAKLFDKMKPDLKAPKTEKTHTPHASKLDISKAQVSDPATTVQNPRKDQQ